MNSPEGNSKNYVPNERFPNEEATLKDTANKESIQRTTKASERTKRKFATTIKISEREISSINKNIIKNDYPRIRNPQLYYKNTIATN